MDAPLATRLEFLEIGSPLETCPIMVCIQRAVEQDA